MQSVQSDLRANRLLAPLADATLAAIAPRMERVDLPLRQVLLEEGGPFTHAWFPAEGVISVMGGAATSVEVATVGREGVLGIPLLLGAQRSIGVAFPQVLGWGWRMRAADFLDAVQRHADFSHRMHRYAGALLAQVSQATACNRVHGVHQRCARWLLQTHDRVTGDVFDLTQEFLAEMLGERRATVNAAASGLSQRGFIRYSRGRIEVMDRAGLEQATCECYHLIREAYAEVLVA